MTIIDELERAMPLDKAAGHRATLVHHHVLRMLIDAYKAQHGKVVPFHARKRAKARDVLEIAE